MQADRQGIDFYYFEHFFVEEKQQKGVKRNNSNSCFLQQDLDLTSLSSERKESSIPLHSFLLENPHFSILVIISLS